MIKFFIDQHGCAKNQTDGELIVSYLQNQGFNYTTKVEDADFIIINSCGFIQSAKKESIDAVYNVKKQFPNAKIVLTGCLAERYADILAESMSELDGIFGNGDLSKISDFMKTVLNGKKAKQIYEQKGVCAENRLFLLNYKGSAYVKITEGCSNHCTFCAIPLIRGELRSRNADSIISEIKNLIANGVYEINLIGQDLAAYGTGSSDSNVIDGDKTKSPLYRLLKKISELKGEFIIRLLYIHPDHFNMDILEILKNDTRFAQYFDIPFQSGDDQIIHSMNRRGTGLSYTKLINDIKAVLPDCVIRTTFLTGFPGEQEENFENTKRFLQTIKPHWSGCFAYSREEDTPAYKMKNRVPQKIAEQRATILTNLQSEITQEHLENYIDKEVSVIIEDVLEDKEEDEGLAIGRSWFQAPEVDGCVVVRYPQDNPLAADCIKSGNVVKVRVIASTGVDLDSEFVELVKPFPNNSKITFIQD